MTIADRPHAMLDPYALTASTQEAVSALMREGSSPNTLAAYRAAIRYWAAWYGLRYQQPFSLPLSAQVVIQFLVDHALRSEQDELVCELPYVIDAELVRQKVKGRPGPLSLNTIQHRLSVLSKAHQIHGHENPCRAPDVQQLLARVRRAYARRNAAPVRKDALTKDILEKLLETCDESLRGRRDAALLLFAWSTGGRRRSEVVAATVENTTRVAEDAYLYALGHSKTNQSGTARAGDAKPLVGMAARALTMWLEASGIRSGAIFRRVRRGGVLGEPLSAPAVRNIVLERCRQAGVEGDFSAHSLRSGFVTEAGRQNVPLGDTMALTGHASVATVLGYFRAGSVLSIPAARLFDPESQS